MGVEPLLRRDGVEVYVQAACIARRTHRAVVGGEDGSMDRIKVGTG
ncbi:MAG: hypothetical protein IPK16_26275 [Anaerolineales bacterium]|nr:hypothetical protein [Anaerolineales bacterium]